MAPQYISRSRQATVSSRAVDGRIAKDLERGRVPLVDAQVAIAIDILLALPLRPQNLSSSELATQLQRTEWSARAVGPSHCRQRHKDKKQDIVSEVPDEIAHRLRWYRRHVLPRLGADVNGSLFVTESGSRKSQATLTRQITDAIMRHIGIPMTPHQFRHFGATSYLEQHPEDFETARAILGHSSSKTTRIYAGASSRRASRAYNQYLLEQREALQAAAPTKEAEPVKLMPTLKHLPLNEWPEADREAFRAAYEPGDVFDETAGPGAHLAEATRGTIRATYRRWLGFLKANHPEDLRWPPPSASCRSGCAPSSTISARR